MRDRRDVGDGGHLEAGGLERADRRLAAGARALARRPRPGACRAPSRVGAARSAACAAAYGVLLREPLKPTRPALPQLTTLPVGSVIVTIVLLNVDWMCACPTGTFFRSRFLALLCCALSLCHGTPVSLLLAPDADGLLRTARAGGRSSWCAGRGPAGCADGGGRGSEPISISRLMFRLTSRRRSPSTLKRSVDDLAQAVDLLLGQVADAVSGETLGRTQDLAGRGRPDAVDVGERRSDPLLAGNVDAGDTCHVLLPLPLLVLGNDADDHHHAGALDHLARSQRGLTDAETFISSCT